MERFENTTNRNLTSFSVGGGSSHDRASKNTSVGSSKSRAKTTYRSRTDESLADPKEYAEKLLTLFGELGTRISKHDEKRREAAELKEKVEELLMQAKTAREEFAAMAEFDALYRVYDDVSAEVSSLEET